MVLWSNVNIFMETNIFQNTLFYYFHSRHKTSFSCRVYPNSSLDYTTPLLWICYKDNRKIFAMKNKGRRIKKGFQRATAILLALIVVVLISSCSSDIPQLCNVSVQLEGSGSRELSAVIDPLSGYTIYYKSIYRGSGASYGNMAESPYKKLDENGILVSQGLWEIKVILSTNPQWDGKGTGSTSDLVASSGDVFINLNTTSITVQLQNNIGKGYIYISSYELVEPPKNVSITVTYYKYDETKSSFSSTGTLSVQKSETGNVFSSNEKEIAWSGTYYAVVEVKGSVSGTQKTLFTDCIGFVVRSGLTTKLYGSCSNYDSSISTSTTINVNTKEGSTVVPITDIKNFDNIDTNEFTFIDNAIYVLPNEDYSMIPDRVIDDNGNLAPSEKRIEGGKNVTINMNGHAIINSKNGSDKTYFLISDTSSLTIYNSINKAKTIGSDDTNCEETNFIVNGGTLTLGSKSVDKQQGEIALKGIQPGNDVKDKISAIEYTSKGGTINLWAPEKKDSISVEKTIRGISRIANEENQNKGRLDLTINMLNSSINAKGDNNITEAGIFVDGTNKTTEPKSLYTGEIQINISGIGKDGFSIRTDNLYGVTSNERSCIVIKNYAGDITITLSDNAILEAKKGRPIYLDNCTGSITINVNNCRFTSANATDSPILLKDCSTSVGNTISIPEGYYQTIKTPTK